MEVLIIFLVVAVAAALLFFFIKRNKRTKDILLEEETEILLKEDYNNSILTIFSSAKNPIIAEYKGREGWKYTNIVDKDGYDKLRNFFTEEQLINRFRFAGLNPYKPSMIPTLVNKMEKAFDVKINNSVKFLDEESEKEYNKGINYQKNSVSVINLNGEHILQDFDQNANQIIEMEHFTVKSEIQNPNVSFYLLKDDDGRFRVNVFKLL